MSIKSQIKDHLSFGDHSISFGVGNQNHRVHLGSNNLGKGQDTKTIISIVDEQKPNGRGSLMTLEIKGEWELKEFLILLESFSRKTQEYLCTME